MDRHIPDGATHYNKRNKMFYKPDPKNPKQTLCSFSMNIWTLSVYKPDELDEIFERIK